MPDATLRGRTSDRVPAAFALRKLHALAGVVPLGVFLVGHLWAQSAAIDGPGALAGRMTLAGPVSQWLFSAGLLVPLAFHAGYGLLIVLRSRPNVDRYPLRHNWLFTGQRLTGVVALVFVLSHLWHVWIPVRSGDLAADQVYQRLAWDLSTTAAGVPLLALGYALGIVATCFHFSHGLWRFGVSFGLLATRRGQQIAGVATSCVFLALLVGGLRTVVFHATGDDPLPGATPALEPEIEGELGPACTDVARPPGRLGR